MTSLTLNGSAVAASTLAAAGKLFNATGGTSGNTSTKVGSGTLFKQIFAKGTTTNQTGVSSIPTPTDSNFNGWMWDVTTLEGQLLQAGTLTPTIHLLASTGTTITPTVQWFKRTSGGVYTQLATVAGSSIALTTSSQALTFTPPSMSDTAFSTGDKLVMWLWVNQTAGGATNSTISVVEATSASSAGVTSEVQTVTQGFIPIVTTTYSFTDQLIASANKPTTTYSAVVLADSPIRYYRLGEASGPTITDVGSQAQNGTPNGTLTYSQVGLITQDPDTAITFTSASSNSISLPTTGLPSGASAWSIECWAKLATLPGAGNYLITLGLGTKAAGTIIEIYYDGDVTEWVFDTDQDAILSAVISANTAYHLVMTYDGISYTAYVNGVSIGSKTHTLNITYSSNAFIGQEAGGFFFNGIIDEVAIYSATLSAAQVATHYSAGISSFGTITATETNLPTDSLTATESLLKTDVVLPTDSLSIAENVLVTGVDIPAETNSVIESLLVQETSSLTDSLVTTESLLVTDTDVPTSSLSASDFGNMQAWGIDALTASESLLLTDMILPTESLSAQDSVLMGGVTLPTEVLSATESVLSTGSALPIDALTIAETGLISGTVLPTDALTVSDTALSTDGSSYTEANSASESFLGSGTSQAIESLSTSDALFEVDGYVPLDSLSASDSQVSGGVYLPLEGLTGVTSPLEWDVYLPEDDTLSADDSTSTMTQDVVGGGVVTTTYRFEDDLVIVESMLTISVDLSLDGLTMRSSVFTTSTPSLTEGLVIAESLLVTEENTPTTSLVASDSLLQTDAVLPIESLSIARSMTIQGTGILLDTLAIAESLLVTESDLSIDGLTASDFANMQVWGISALVVTESLLQTSGTLPIENLSISDTFLTTYESVFSEATSVLDAYLLAQGYVPLDTLSARSTEALGGIYTPAEVLALLERLLGENSVSWVDETTASDSFDGEMLPAAVLSSHPLGSSPAFYQGNTVIPTRPSGVYAVNGVILDSQPTVCTAPLAAQGVRFLAGSTFFLFFQRPTTRTQTLLANGQTVSMTFALANGQMVTGHVQVASTLVAATSFSVLCTLVSADVALAL